MPGFGSGAHRTIAPGDGKAGPQAPQSRLPDSPLAGTYACMSIAVAIRNLDCQRRLNLMQMNSIVSPYVAALVHGSPFINLGCTAPEMPSRS